MVCRWGLGEEFDAKPLRRKVSQSENVYQSGESRLQMGERTQSVLVMPGMALTHSYRRSACRLAMCDVSHFLIQENRPNGLPDQGSLGS